MNATDKALTVYEASLIGRLPEGWIEQMTKKGEIEGYQVQCSPSRWCWLISKSSFAKYLKTHGLCGILFCFLFSQGFWGSPNSGISYAEEANVIADWTKNEQWMHDSLKEAQPGKSEAEIQETMGCVFLKTDNQWKQAAVHLKQAVQLDPKLFKAWYELGLIYMGSEEGDGYFKKSVEANPDFAPSSYWIAYNACRAGRDPAAISYFERYLKVAKGEGEAGRIETAQKILKELRSGKPGDEVEKLRT